MAASYQTQKGVRLAGTGTLSNCIRITHKIRQLSLGDVCAAADSPSLAEVEEAASR